MHMYLIHLLSTCTVYTIHCTNIARYNVQNIYRKKPELVQYWYPNILKKCTFCQKLEPAFKWVFSTTLCSQILTSKDNTSLSFLGRNSMFPRKCQVRAFRCATVELYSGKIIVWINNLVVYCRRVRSHCPKNNMNLCLKPSLLKDGAAETENG